MATERRACLLAFLSAFYFGLLFWSFSWLFSPALSASTIAEAVGFPHKATVRRS
jgi:hypothetical protein